MTAVVIDSTIALAWLFEDERTPASEAVLDQLTDDEAVVPSVWPLEVTNALLDAESHGRLSEGQASRMLSLVAQLPITVDRSSDDSVAVHAAARRHNLSAYQASYLVLAERLGVPVATADATLSDAAHVAGVPVQ